MSLTIRKPGVLTTVQDLGRFGARSQGVNPSGVMDVTAARLVNVVVGNIAGAPVLESHFPGPIIEFDAETVLAIGGADFDACLNGEGIPNWSSVFVKAGSVLEFAHRLSGSRAYIAVQGGFVVEEWLGSASTNLAASVGGFRGRKLLAGDRVHCAALSRSHASMALGPSVIPRYSRFPTIRVVPASEFEFLTSTAERTFFGEGFVLSGDCDRMGYRLMGKPLHLLHDLEMVSSAVTFGTIQLLPDGQLIVLMADHQTSGGYPRIANVISADLPILAQCAPGDGVGFELVSVADAEQLALRLETELNFLRVGCRLRNHNAFN